MCGIWARRGSGKLLAVYALVFISTLAACGGGGGGGANGGSPAAGPTGPSKVFVADSVNAIVVSSANANPSPGTFTLERTISGPSVSNIMPDMAYDSAADRLYIVNNRSIAVVDHASTATGLVAPARIISSPSIVSTIGVISLDAVKDLLYVADGAMNVLVFNNVSTANGPTIPSRTLTITRVSGPVSANDLFVDTTRDILYVSGHVGGAGGVNKVILAYDQASTITDPIVANRELTFTESIWHIVGDSANDRLFVSDNGAATVMVFDAVSIANGPGVPARTINLPDLAQRLALAPVSDRLYAITANTLGVHVINGASMANGSVPITLVTSPSAGSLTAIAVAP